jgi:hypothetical protein
VHVVRHFMDMAGEPFDKGDLGPVDDPPVSADEGDESFDAVIARLATQDHRFREPAVIARNPTGAGQLEDVEDHRVRDGVAPDLVSGYVGNCN